MQQQIWLRLGSWIVVGAMVVGGMNSTTARAFGGMLLQDEQEPEKKLNPQEVFEKATALIEDGKTKEALQLVEKLVEQQPKHRQALAVAAQLNHQVGIEIVQNGERKDANKYLLQCAEHMRALHKLADGKLDPQLAEFYAVAIYNEACSLAVAGKKEPALKVLDEAIEAGFDQLTVLENDEDFKSVKDDPKFKELVEKLREKKKIRT